MFACTATATAAKICPDVDEYKMYYAQALYKAGLYPEATRAAVRVDNPQYSQRMLMLQSAIKYEQVSGHARGELLAGGGVCCDHHRHHHHHHH